MWWCRISNDKTLKSNISTLQPLEADKKEIKKEND